LGFLGRDLGRELILRLRCLTAAPSLVVPEDAEEVSTKDVPHVHT
jgi:hypothetical protein